MPPTPNPPANGPITAAELAQHASANDCWSVYFGAVYDMTNYNHPGGQGFIQVHLPDDVSQRGLGELLDGIRQVGEGDNDIIAAAT